MPARLRTRPARRGSARDRAGCCPRPWGAASSRPSGRSTTACANRAARVTRRSEHHRARDQVLARCVGELLRAGRLLGHRDVARRANELAERVVRDLGRSIQKPSTDTRWTGCASAWDLRGPRRRGSPDWRRPSRTRRRDPHHAARRRAGGDDGLAIVGPNGLEFAGELDNVAVAGASVALATGTKCARTFVASFEGDAVRPSCGRVASRRQPAARGAHAPPLPCTRSLPEQGIHECWARARRWSSERSHDSGGTALLLR